jgi:hypothetical protein
MSFESKEINDATAAAGLANGRMKTAALRGRRRV